MLCYGSSSFSLLLWVRLPVHLAYIRPLCIVDMRTGRIVIEIGSPLLLPASCCCTSHLISSHHSVSSSGWIGPAVQRSLIFPPPPRPTSSPFVAVECCGRGEYLFREKIQSHFFMIVYLKDVHVCKMMFWMPPPPPPHRKRRNKKRRRRRK